MGIQKRRDGRPKALAALIGGAVIGGLSGALIGYAFDGREGASAGALVVGLYMGLAEAYTDFRRQPGELKPQWHRNVGSTIVGAAVAVLFSFILDDILVISLAMGLVVGLVALGPRKLVLGLAIGLVVGVGAEVFYPDLNPAVAGALVVFSFRLLQLLLFKDSAPLTLSGERVPPSKARYVVPFEARTKYIGAEFMEKMARDSNGQFRRNKPGIGIVESLDALRGPHFDPALVDPLIRDFYEHTTNYKLSIEPVWNPFIKPFFWLFKNFIAQKIGQANLPFNTEEAHRGMVSYVDSIDYLQDDSPAGQDHTTNNITPHGQVSADNPTDTPEHILTLRGWIRAYEDSGEAIYVGIYTVVRYQDTGYVSVGFPLPEANFTATLLPYNKGRGLLLKTMDTGSSFPGHYLTDIDNDDGSLTILKLPTMGEEIDVYVEEGALKTDHRFFFGGYRFLTLYYTIEQLNN